MEAIIGNKLVPGFLDHYLGRNGFASQQTNEPEDPDRPDNLWKPLPGDHGADGDFDSLARPRSLQLKANLNRRWIGIGMALAAAGWILAQTRQNNQQVAEY